MALDSFDKFYIQEAIDASIREAFKSHNTTSAVKTARWDYEGSRTVSCTSDSGKPPVSNVGGSNGMIHYSYEQKDYRCSHCGALYHNKTDYCPDCGFVMDNGPNHGNVGRKV